MVYHPPAAPEPSQPAPVVFTPKDPLRMFGGKLYKISGDNSPTGMVSFRGEIVEVQSGGVRIDDGSGRDIFVANFPYQVAEREYVGEDAVSRTVYYARSAGTYTYPTAIGGSRTIRKLDYGEVYTPPPPAPPTKEQLAATKTAEAERKNNAAAASLKYNQDQADKGDAYGLLRMGERYRDGAGVPRDLAKARDYLTRALAAGNESASNALLNLPQQ